MAQTLLALVLPRRHNQNMGGRKQWPNRNRRAESRPTGGTDPVETSTPIGGSDPAVTYLSAPDSRSSQSMADLRVAVTPPCICRAWTLVARGLRWKQKLSWKPYLMARSSRHRLLTCLLLRSRMRKGRWRCSTFEPRLHSEISLNSRAR